MSLSIATNQTALSVNRNLAINETSASNHSRNLATGSRITNAATDSAASSIGLRLTSLINNMEQASRNATQGNTLVQTAVGGAEEIIAVLDRMKVLSSIAASDGVDTDARNLAQKEFDKMQEQVTNIAGETRFNGISLLTGGTVMDFRVNTLNTDVLTFTMPEMSAASLVVSGISILAKTDANTASTSLDAALTTAREHVANLGAFQAQLTVALSNLATSIENAKGARSSFVDADITDEMTSKTRHEMLIQTGFSALSGSFQHLRQIASFVQQS